MASVRGFTGRLLKLLTSRIPDTQNILGVCAVIVSLVYSWTLITSFYQFPSWFLFLTPGQILSIYAYSFSVDLVECVLILAGLFILETTVFFPLKNKDEIQSRSILLVFIFLSSSMARLLIYKSFESSEAFISGELFWWGATLLLGVPFAILIPKHKKNRDMIENIAERLTVFLYIYIPLSVVSLLVVLARNLY